jgi:hypothetical protein
MRWRRQGANTAAQVLLHASRHCLLPANKDATILMDEAMLLQCNWDFFD